jgi:hypothetical protein
LWLSLDYFPYSEKNMFMSSSVCVSPL